MLHFYLFIKTKTIARRASYRLLKHKTNNYYVYTLWQSYSGYYTPNQNRQSFMEEMTKTIWAYFFLGHGVVYIYSTYHNRPTEILTSFAGKNRLRNDLRGHM